MALLSPQLQRVLLNRIDCNLGYYYSSDKTDIILPKGRGGGRCCSAIAIDTPSSLAGVRGIRWGSTKLEGARQEMFFLFALTSDGQGFSFAAVFDGHAGLSSVKFLRDELYRQCVEALQGGLLLTGKNISDIRKAIQDAFQNADAELLNWLETNGEETESGSTATALFINNNMLFISHVGDSCAVDLGLDAEFVLLASDGLWDYMKSSEAVSFVRNQLRKHGDAQVVLDPRSQDNISIVIGDLERTDWQSVPLQQQNFVYELGQAFATIGIVSFVIWMTSVLAL